MDNSNATSAGFPILGVLGLIFITLKLTGTIAWSWWWVLAPFWLPFLIGAIILAVWFIAMLVGMRNGGNPWR